MQWLDAARARLRLLFAGRTEESWLNEEFRLHIDLEAERLMREKGLAPDEARRRALAAFGGVEKHKEAMRDGRGLAWLSGFSLDLKLAVRMLVKYPALTLVGGAAMAFGIAAGVGVFELRTQFVNPSLPLDEGWRIVGLRYWHVSQNRPAASTAYDFAAWRDQLKLVDDVSAFSASSRNLITDDGRSEAETIVAMSASAFRVVRVPPPLGPTLVEADEDPVAPPVIVIGHDIWNRRFSGDPDIVGRTVRLGREQTTVVGVMPEGFAFPAAHGLWVPLRDSSVGSSAGSIPRGEPPLLVFGRLSPGVSSEQAQAELTAVGLRAAAGSPETHEHLRPQLVPYARLAFDRGSIEFQLALALGNAFVVMLLVLVSANVALLMFARAATRETEIAVRSALGAGRARIVTQLFVEALVLAGGAVAIGLATARVELRSLFAAIEADSGQRLPFWMGDSLTPTTVIYAGMLTVLTASITGVLPALKVTGRGLQGRLRQSTAGGGGFRFGGVWTAVIASQVAVTLMFPAAAFFFHRAVITGQTRDVGFSSERFLSGRLELDREAAPGVPLDGTEDTFRWRIRRTYAALEQRVIVEPEVVGLTFADRLPGTLHPRWRIEIDGEAPAEDRSFRHAAGSASIALNYFDVLGAPILAGRAFTAADLASDVAIVNQSFVKQVLGGRNPIGQRVRPFDEDEKPGPWLEVVGMVRDLGMVGGEDGNEGAGLYRPMSPETVSVLRIAIGVRGNPESFAARLRAVASEVEPALQIHDLMRLDEVGANMWLGSQYMSRVMAALSALALLLSLTAIYSVMAFTVTQRTREIGIRVALGADRRHIIGAILRRPLAQVGVGIVAGAVLVAGVFVVLVESTPTITESALIAAYSALMMVVCLLACIVPTLRALRIEPARVLTVDG